MLNKNIKCNIIYIKFIKFSLVNICICVAFISPTLNGTHLQISNIVLQLKYTFCTCLIHINIYLSDTMKSKNKNVYKRINIFKQISFLVFQILQFIIKQFVLNLIITIYNSSTLYFIVLHHITKKLFNKSTLTASVCM